MGKKELLTVVLAGLGVLTGMVIWHCWPQPPAPLTPWQKVELRLQEADTVANQTADKQIQRVQDFFRDKKSKTRQFAEDALSLSGKWAYLKGWMDDGASHHQFLRESFEQHVMRGDELEELAKQIGAGYIAELQGQENDLLVAIRADLSTEELPSLSGTDIQGSDEAFKKAYQAMVEEVKPLLLRDLQVTFGREAATWIGGNIAAAALTNIASQVAVKMGISGGILGSGAASGLATFGVGLVIGYIADQIVDFILRQAGYDPVGKVEQQVNQTLDKLAQSLIDTLRPKLNGMSGARSRLRAAALQKLIVAEEKGGVQ